MVTPNQGTPAEIKAAEGNPRLRAALKAYFRDRARAQALIDLGNPSLAHDLITAFNRVELAVARKEHRTALTLHVDGGGHARRLPPTVEVFEAQLVYDEVSAKARAWLFERAAESGRKGA